MKNIIFTAGHSSRAFSEFLKNLQDHEIDTVVDVRTFPRSRFSPQYNQKALSESLNKEGISYLFRGRNLGGRGENIAYDDTIDELVEMVRFGKRVCVMCSEADYRKCHRYEMLTPSFEERRLEVKHILYEN